ncbi:DUF4097 family beta strand repeat-containing protein [Nocardia sp. NPDC024068]|uniref:DUF4097 family beta strand repeat-containing protein n=1 Tax=Nocardia sp. NPDC024068 TaxID=3157197 RepID=UPI00340F87A9
MPKYDTPEPISVTIELGFGHVRLAASDRTDTVVEVRPTDESDDSDVKAASQVRVDYTNGVLRVTGPRRRIDFSNKSRAVDVDIELPSGSRVSADLQAGDVRGTGLLGQCGLETSAGNVRLDRTGPLRVKTAAGHVTAETVTGDAEISTGSGKVRLGEVRGVAEVKNSNGETVIGAVTGEARVRAANGDIRIERAGADVHAKSSNGGIRLDEVVRGSVEIETAMGDLEIGIAEGTAAWLSVNTKFGAVRNLLTDAAGPEKSDETVEVRGRTSFGDITVQRS